MNNKFNRLLVFFVVMLLLQGCITLESLSLDNNSGLYKSDEKYSSAKIVLYSKANPGLTNWFSCVKGNPALALDSSAVRVSFIEGKGDCFGIYFTPRDVSRTPLIKIRAKFISSADAASVDILGGFTDDKDGKTYYPEKGKLLKSGKDFADYYFDYSSEIQRSDKSIDPSKVKTVLIFLNILGVSHLSGNILVEEVSLHSK